MSAVTRCKVLHGAQSAAALKRALQARQSAGREDVVAGTIDEGMQCHCQRAPAGGWTAVRRIVNKLVLVVADAAGAAQADIFANTRSTITPLCPR